MVPITTYFLLLVSSFFSIVWDARIVLEEYAAQRDRLGFRQSSLGLGLRRKNSGEKAYSNYCDRSSYSRINR
ncbi:unnamed protein product [Lathyrus oleraceus]